MTKFITLKDITASTRPPRDLARHIDTMHRSGIDENEDDGEDDGFSQPEPLAITDQTSPGWKARTVNTDSIREFHPRTGGQPGCRVFLKGKERAIVVLDSHEDILALING